MASGGSKRARVEGASDVSEGPGKTPTLYSYWRSSCSWRVRIVLELMGIEYNYNAVHLLKDGGEQLKEDYAARNPMKVLPTLEIDGTSITQSMAIIEYLLDTRSVATGVTLYPADALGKARVRQMVYTVVCDTQPVQNLRVLKHVMGWVEGSEAKTERKLSWGKHYVAEGFRGLEPLLAAHAGKYSYGDEITLADVVLVPQVYNANRFGVDFSEFPTIKRVSDALADHPSFKRSHPSAVPDHDT